MANFYKRLKEELDSGHPVTGAYNIDDALAANELNAQNINIDGGILEMINYLAINRSRTNDGLDTTRTALLGRLKHIAESAVGDSVFGRTGANDTVTLEAKHAAQTFLTLFSAPSVSTLNFLDTELDGAYVVLGPPGSGGIGVWKDPDILALKGFSSNRISRAFELGFPIIETVDITTARAL